MSLLHTPPRRVTPAWRSPGLLLAHVATVAALAVWWVYSQFVPAYLVPGPEAVAARMADFLIQGRLALQLGISVAHVLSAIAIAFVVGVTLAFVATYISATRLFIDGVLTPFLNAFSGVGWLFLALLWFGLNSQTVVFAVAMILIPFTVINVRTGLQELDRDLQELGKSLSRHRLRHEHKIVFPQLVPYFFASLRTSFGVSWKVVLVSELFGGNAGAGYLLNIARQELDTETIFAVIVFIILFVAAAEHFFFRPIQRSLDRRYSRG